MNSRGVPATGREGRWVGALGRRKVESQPGARGAAWKSGAQNLGVTAVRMLSLKGVQRAEIVRRIPHPCTEGTFLAMLTTALIHNNNVLAQC